MESVQAKLGHNRFRKEVLLKNKNKKRFAGEYTGLNLRDQVLATHWDFYTIIVSGPCGNHSCF